LAWQATGVAADIAGTIDPTPVSDLVSAGVSVRNGDLWGAALSTVSMVPYLGDAVAKPVKAVRATKAIAGLTEKATALRKTITDLTKAKKEAEAATEIATQDAKIANKADTLKDTATQQEKAAKKCKDTEDCGLAGKKPSQKMKQARTPCFSSKKLDPTKAKEFSKQLGRQEAALNKLTVKEYLDARTFFDDNKRKGTGAAQRKARADYKSQLIQKLRSQYKKEKMPAGQINAAAERDAAAKMKNLAALHEPDMIAGGGDVVHGLGDKYVNSSIGSQWKSRVESLDTAAKKIDEAAQSNTMMNAKLPECK
jgi:hypothetical protein